MGGLDEAWSMGMGEWKNRAGGSLGLDDKKEESTSIGSSTGEEGCVRIEGKGGGDIESHCGGRAERKVFLFVAMVEVVEEGFNVGEGSRRELLEMSFPNRRATVVKAR